MPLTIACLHTAESNAPLFETSAAALPGGALRLTHRVRADLLREPTPETLAEASLLLREMATDADAVLLTCTTIGAAVEGAQDAPCPVVRADAALAEAATRSGGPVDLLYAAPTTRESTQHLFAAAASRSGATLTLHLVERAWALFLAGRIADYHARIAAAAEGLTGRVVLAQASMAGAAALMQGAPPLTLPAIGVMSAARSAMQARKSG